MNHILYSVTFDSGKTEVCRAFSVQSACIIATGRQMEKGNSWAIKLVTNEVGKKWLNPSISVAVERSTRVA